MFHIREVFTSSHFKILIFVIFAQNMTVVTILHITMKVFVMTPAPPPVQHMSEVLPAFRSYIEGVT